MKRIKKIIDEENNEIIKADRDFWEQTLKPKIMEKQKDRTVSTKKIAVFICSFCLIIICGTLLTYKFLFHYTNIDELKSDRTNLQYVNSFLTETQIIGKYDAISSVSKVRTKEPVYFILNSSFDEFNDTSISCLINVFVDRSYGATLILEYKDSFYISDFTVMLNKTIEQIPYESGFVFIHKIQAFMDTGAEQYWFDYEEVTLNDTDNFSLYLLNVLTVKETWEEV